MAAAVQTRPTISVGERRQLFEGVFAAGSIFRDYDVTRDGQSFVMVRPAGQSQMLVVVLNWFEQLRGQGSPGAAAGAAAH